MVISVPSSQDTEIYRPKPSPVNFFVDDVNEMVDNGHHSSKGEETALQAGRREVQEGIKVKFPYNCILAHYFAVSHRLSMCKSLEIHVPSMTVNPSILAPRSCGFGLVFTILPLLFDIFCDRIMHRILASCLPTQYLW